MQLQKYLLMIQIHACNTSVLHGAYSTPPNSEEKLGYGVYFGIGLIFMMPGLVKVVQDLAMITHITYWTSWGFFGYISNGLSIHSHRSRYVNRFQRRNATRLQSAQPNLDLNFILFPLSSGPYTDQMNISQRCG